MINDIKNEVYQYVNTELDKTSRIAILYILGLIE